MKLRLIIPLLAAIIGLTAGASVVRTKRQQFAPLKSCTVSHEEIDDLVRITKNLNSAVEAVELGTRSGFDEEASNRDRCSRQLAQFRGTVQNMVQNYKSINRNSMSQAQYDRAKAQYQNEIQRLLRKIDNLKRDVEDSYRGEVEKLRNNMQQFKVQLDDNLTLLEQERAKNQKAFVRLCIANIRSGRVNDAVEDFRNLNDLPYEKIVTDVYENDPQNADLVLNFLEAIDLYYEPIRGYEVLFRLTKRNNQLNRPAGRMLLLHLMALVMAEDEHSRQASTLLNTFKMSV